MSRLTITKKTYEGKKGWKDIKTILAFADTHGFNEVIWKSCTFRKIELNQADIKTPTQQEFIDWLYSQHTSLRRKIKNRLIKDTP